jgi:hypothetical protein
MCGLTANSPRLTPNLSANPPFWSRTPLIATGGVADIRWIT